MGKKVTLNPMNMSQKLSFPSPSFSRRPVILGHQ